MDTYGTTLGRVRNSTYNDELTDFLANVDTLAGNVYLGGSDRTVEGTWIWPDNDEFWSGAETGSAVGGLYNNWNPGAEPNDLGGEDCLVVFPHGPSRTATWNDVDCSLTEYFACSKEHILLVNQAMNWTEARTYCQTQFGTDLAIINSQELNDEAEKLLRMESENPAWIGGNSLSNPVIWQWVDGTNFFNQSSDSAINGEYENFNGGEPGSPGVEQCLEVHIGFGFNDLSCSENRVFFCDVVPYPTPSPTSAPTSVTSSPTTITSAPTPVETLYLNASHNEWRENGCELQYFTKGTPSGDHWTVGPNVGFENCMHGPYTTYDPSSLIELDTSFTNFTLNIQATVWLIGGTSQHYSGGLDRFFIHLYLGGSFSHQIWSDYTSNYYSCDLPGNTFNLLNISSPTNYSEPWYTKETATPLITAGGTLEKVCYQSVNLTVNIQSSLTIGILFGSTIGDNQLYDAWAFSDVYLKVINRETDTQNNFQHFQCIAYAFLGSNCDGIMYGPYGIGLAIYYGINNNPGFQNDAVSSFYLIAQEGYTCTLEVDGLVNVLAYTIGNGEYTEKCINQSTVSDYGVSVFGGVSIFRVLYSLPPPTSSPTSAPTLTTLTPTSVTSSPTSVEILYLNSTNNIFEENGCELQYFRKGTNSPDHWTIGPNVGFKNCLHGPFFRFDPNSLIEFNHPFNNFTLNFNTRGWLLGPAQPSSLWFRKVLDSLYVDLYLGGIFSQQIWADYKSIWNSCYLPGNTFNFLNISSPSNYTTPWYTKEDSEILITAGGTQYMVCYIDINLIINIQSSLTVGLLIGSSITDNNEQWGFSDVRIEINDGYTNTENNLQHYKCIAYAYRGTHCNGTEYGPYTIGFHQYYDSPTFANDNINSFYFIAQDGYTCHLDVDHFGYLYYTIQQNTETCIIQTTINDNNGSTFGGVSSFRVLYSLYTPQPTSSPTESPDCDYDSGNFTVNWQDLLQTDSVNQILQPNITSSRVNSNSAPIAINVVAQANYVVDATYLDNNVGVTYVLDTAQFEDSGRFIGTDSDTNICENRNSSDFTGDFSSFWEYTLDQGNSNEFPGSQGSFLAYPRSNWDLSMTNGISCTSVTWNRTFSFDDLRNDCGFVWDDSQTDVISLTGTFYLTLVSPNYLTYDTVTDAGQYITKQVFSHEITIEFVRSSTLIQSASVQLYGAYIISIDYDRNSNSNQFEFTVMTYVPNYLQLTDTTSVETSNIYSYGDEEDTSYSPSECLVQDDYRCWQKFIYSTSVNCTSSGSLTLDDTFEIFGNIDCVNAGDDLIDGTACNEFLTGQYPNNAVGVNIGQIMLAYTESCDSALYDVSFTGTLVFYDVDTNLEIVAPTFSNGDTAYVRVSMDSPIDSYSVFGIEIESVTICTADVADGVDITTCVGQDTSLLYTGTPTSSDAEINLQIISTDTTDSSEEFSFLVPLLADDRFFVECQVLLTLNNVRRRARVLLQDQVNRFGSAFNSASYSTSSTSNNNGKSSNNDSLSTGAIIGISIAAVVVLIAGIAIAMFGFNYMKLKQAVKEKDAVDVVTSTNQQNV